MRLVIFGPPGAGKGTQAERIATAWSIPHISTGEMLREAVASSTELGEKVKAVLESGHLVSDELMVSLIGERLAMSDAKQGWLLDGYPRTVPQVGTLAGILEESLLDRVVSLKVADHVLIERIRTRAIEAGQGKARTDDNEKTVRNRLEVYKKLTAPVAEIYRQQGILAEIDGTGTINEVFVRITDVLEEIQG